MMASVNSRIGAISPWVRQALNRPEWIGASSTGSLMSAANCRARFHAATASERYAQLPRSARP